MTKNEGGWSWKYSLGTLLAGISLLSFGFLQKGNPISPLFVVFGIGLLMVCGLFSFLDSLGQKEDPHLERERLAYLDWRQNEKKEKDKR